MLTQHWGIFFTNRNKLGIECNNLSKFFKRHGWQGVYHHIPILDLKVSFLQLWLCKEVVPIRGIKIVQTTFWLIPLMFKVSSERCLT